MRYVDRRDAGRQLAGQLSQLADERPVIVAVPRGGVPIAAEVARALHAPLEILAVRKLGAPGNPELGVGAVSEDGTGVLDARSADLLGMTQAMLDQTLADESAELRRRVGRYRRRPAISVRGRTAIVVDDGLATGLTDLAAVRTLRKRGARRIVVAVPVGSSESVSMLSAEADSVVCLTIPRRLYGVGMWYRDFTPVSDEQVLALLAQADGDDDRWPSGEREADRELSFDLGPVRLAAILSLPTAPRGTVLFAHGSGSGRSSPRNRLVAAALCEAGFATVLLDLLDRREGAQHELTFDISLLAERIALVGEQLRGRAELRSLPLGYFGASTGAAAALQAAAAIGPPVAAVVSRGGRPDLAEAFLAHVVSPTLLIAGGEDRDVLELNRRAAARLRCAHELVVVNGAGHLFEEPGALERVSELTIAWFERHLAA